MTAPQTSFRGGHMVNNNGLPAYIVLSVEDIAKRAYELYVERGRAEGLDREDWRRAEHELADRGRNGQIERKTLRT
jgi:hypothetical protein